ncbi:MAG: hypothetical protein SGPRY_009340, partial [Prymnesium sp.]
VGSLQQFERHVGCADDFSASIFSTEEVQRIALLDIRIFNLDRHGANLLVQRVSESSRRSSTSVSSYRPEESANPLSGITSSLLDEVPAESLSDAESSTEKAPHLGSELQLVPIDHGFSLPARITVPFFEWQYWPQARQPMTKNVRDYISRMDPLADASLLRNAVQEGSGLEVREGCVRTMLLCGTLLQEGAKAGVSFGEIADLMCEPPSLGLGQSWPFSSSIAREAEQRSSLDLSSQSRSPNTVICVPNQSDAQACSGMSEFDLALPVSVGEAGHISPGAIDSTAAIKGTHMTEDTETGKSRDSCDNSSIDSLELGKVHKENSSPDVDGSACCNPTSTEEMTMLQLFVAHAEAEAESKIRAIAMPAPKVIHNAPSSVQAASLQGSIEQRENAASLAGTSIWASTSTSALGSMSLPQPSATSARLASPPCQVKLSPYDEAFHAALRKRVSYFFQHLRKTHGD